MSAELDAAIANLQAALAHYQSQTINAAAPLASRAYADYAQAAFDLRHAQRVLEAAQRKNDVR